MPADKFWGKHIYPKRLDFTIAWMELSFSCPTQSFQIYHSDIRWFIMKLRSLSHRVRGRHSSSSLFPPQVNRFLRILRSISSLRFLQNPRLYIQRCPGSGGLVFGCYDHALHSILSRRPLWYQVSRSSQIQYELLLFVR